MEEASSSESSRGSEFDVALLADGDSESVAVGAPLVLGDADGASDGLIVPVGLFEGTPVSLGEADGSAEV